MIVHQCLKLFLKNNKIFDLYEKMGKRKNSYIRNTNKQKEKIEGEVIFEDKTRLIEF